MKYNYFKNANLLVLENNDKRSLYRVYESHNVEPLNWAQNQKRLEVYPEYNLVVTDNRIFTLSGEGVLSDIKGNEISFIQMHRRLLIKTVSQDKSGPYIHLMWWNGRKRGKVAFSKDYVLHNAKYVVCCDGCYGPSGPSWTVYNDIGKKINIGKIGDCDVDLVGDFLIMKGIGQHSVYNLKLKKCIKENQQRIVASPHDNFVMCCSISEGLQTYYRGHWKKYDAKVDDFGLLEDYGAFYIVKSGKYHLYTFDGKPFLNALYPNGSDFVGYNAEDMTCIVVNKGKAYFFI